MTRIYILTLGMLMAMSAFSQLVQTWTEDFEGIPTFRANPTGSWIPDTNYYVGEQGLSTINPKSYLGEVPKSLGSYGAMELITSYNFTGYDFILLKFSHICKISSADIARIEYRLSSIAPWSPIPTHTYLGSAKDYNATGLFSDASYPEWRDDDYLEYPDQSWWKEEIFDLTGVVFGQVQFRFYIERGQQIGTNAAHGWSVDNFQVQAAIYPLYPPTIVECISPFVQGSVYGVGPWEINAKVNAQQGVNILTAMINYTATEKNGTITIDSVTMTPVSGDTLWKGSIPPFPDGTEVSYSVKVRDIIGNDAKITSQYTILEINNCTDGKTPTSDYHVLQGDGGTNNNITVLSFTVGYSRSMSLYTAAEISNDAAGLITKIALRLNRVANTTLPIKVWLKTVPASKTTWSSSTDNLDWSVLTQDATLVYDDGNFHFNQTGWMDINLTTPYIYTRTDNLVFMIEGNYGGTGTLLSQTPYFYVSNSTATANMFWYKRTSTSAPTVSSELTINNNRPDLRIYSFSLCADSNSVQALSIDIKDTVVSSTITPQPILVTIKNRGLSLDSATIYYSVNGTTYPGTTWRGSLSWDFNQQINIGSYTPKLNGKDTILFWVESPNGKTDPVISDDTIRRVIYGSVDILASFVDIPVDTLYEVLPLEISARVSSVSGTALGNVSLAVATTYNGTTTNTTLPMTFDAISGLYKTTIPEKPFGSNIVFSITKTDYLGNVITIKDSCRIVRYPCDAVGEKTIGGGNTSSNQIPFYFGWGGTTRSMVIYTKTEIGGTGYIDKIALSVKTAANRNIPVKIWIKETTITTWSGASASDWSTSGATLIFNGNYIFNQTGWHDFTLSDPYFYSNENNLVLMFEQLLPSGSGTPLFNCTNTANSCWYVAADDNQFTQYPYYGRSGTRPNIRIHQFCSGDSNSVATSSINSPNNSAVTIGTPTPVQITLKNMGIADLDSCNVTWSLNGNIQNTVVYRGKLPEKITDTITVSTYTPLVAGKNDTILVWVSDPNGKTVDALPTDTARITPFVCYSVFPDTVSVGVGRDYATIKGALDIIRTCNITRDVTLVLDGTFPENVDLTGISNYMNGYTLTITSLNNDPDNAIIRPSAGVGITLSNLRDVTIKAITVNLSSSSSFEVNGIKFTDGACRNVVIRDCKILLSKTADYVRLDNAAVIYKENEDVIDSIYIINNLLEGGWFGLYFNGGSSSFGHGKDIVFDNNTVNGSRQYGMFSQFVDFTSCSYNTISSRESGNLTADWNGLVLENCAGPAIGNRIFQRNTGISTPTGIYLNNYNYPGAVRGLFANNEVIMSTGSAGISFNGATLADILHNSVYISGSSSPRGIYFAGNVLDNVDVRNNNIVIIPNGHPVYINSIAGVYTFDYNNYYAQTYMGYRGGNINKTNMSAWRTAYGDLHSITKLPEGIVPASNLSYTYDMDMMCPSIASVMEDIEGITRKNITVMGCYDINPTGQDLMLLGLSAWDTTVIENQNVKIAVEVRNQGAVSITEATFVWVLNGDTQTVSWTANTVLEMLEVQTVIIDSFIATDANIFDLTVWIESINGEPDTVNRNDTVWGSALMKSMVEFVEPFSVDTVYTLSFDVKVLIRTATGAPTSPPQLLLETIIRGAYTEYDTLPLTLVDDIWTVTIPPKYYDSKVIYSLTVSDDTGIPLTVIDSVYIQYKESTFTPYTGHNLAMMNVLSPINLDTICTPNYSPVLITMANLGEEEYDYAQYPVTVSVEVINSRAIINRASVIRNRGVLRSGKIDTVEIMSALPIMYSGVYNIRAWLTSSIDSIAYDDILLYEYFSDKITLPLDEDFSSNILPKEFTSISLLGSEIWEPYTDTNTVSPIIPPTGGGMLRYAGSSGSISSLSTRQVDLIGAVEPKMTFWYYHDATASALDKSYMDVNILEDGVATTVLSLNKRGDTTGWVQYLVDLSNYTTSQCILIQFESMNRSNTLSVQYVAHIIINSKPDLEVAEIIISPEITACEIVEKEIRVVLKSLNNEPIDFSLLPSDLIIEIGSQKDSVPLSTTIRGFLSDTIFVASNMDLKNVTNIKAYISKPVDNNPSNDTTALAINVRPALSVIINQATNANTCFKKGSEVQQEVIIRNTGNMEIPEMELLLFIEDVIPPQIIRETITTPLQAGDSIRYTFNNKYIVPAEMDYLVRVFVWMKCDSALVNNLSGTQECVDLHNLSIIRLDNPPMNSVDTVGSTENIVVTLKNESDNRRYPNVSVTAMIEDENGQMLNSRISILPNIEPLDSALITFTEPYLVPDDSVYYIRIFINSLDVYPEDDTLLIKRYTVDTIDLTDPTIGISSIAGNNAFTLDQNIPNPAVNTTHINYSVPEAGEVVFHVHSISGQLLYSKTIEASHGKNSLELNTNTLAAGIYFYSIEYKGQRLIKRMSIQK
jgi:hypothetical protein